MYEVSPDTVRLLLSLHYLQEWETNAVLGQAEDCCTAVLPLPHTSGQ